MLPKPNLHPRGRDLLNDLRSDGIAPTDSEIAWIFQICQYVGANPPSFGNDGLLAPSFVLNAPGGGAEVEFRQLTIGARMWLSDYALKGIPEDHPYVSYLFAFASIHANSQAVFQRLTDPSRIMTEVIEWARKVLGGFTSEQLEEALEFVFPTDPLSIPQEEDGDSGAFTRAISRICDEVGGTPHDWTWSEPFTLAMDQIAYVGAKDAAEAGAQQTAASDPSFRALLALAHAGNLIRKDRGMPAKYETGVKNGG